MKEVDGNGEDFLLEELDKILEDNINIENEFLEKGVKN